MCHLIAERVGRRDGRTEMRWLAVRLGKLSVGKRMAIQASLTALVAYYCALVGVQIAEILAVHSWALLLLHAGLSIAVLIVLTIASSIVAYVVQVYVDQRLTVMAAANTQLRRATVAESQRLHLLLAAPSSERSVVPHDPLAAIQRLILGIYNTLESHYSEGPMPGEGVSFESTFMTRSPDDGEITILAWANRQGRMPASLRDRATNLRVYQGTVTADIYRSSLTERPRPRLIADTHEPNETYSELYPGQRDRIRSSIVYPVMSPASDLLGTVVVHCDSPRFFERPDFGYWSEVLEVFASRIALEKLRLDNAITYDEIRSPGPAESGSEQAASATDETS
jgi:GAF domain-containing protein